MIDHLDSQLHKNPTLGITYLYTDYKDQANQTLVHILGSFLRQFLATTLEPIPDEIIQQLHDIRRRGRKVEIEDSLAMLKIWLKLHYLKRAFICIDAVDELEPKVRRQLLEVLKELGTNYNTRLFLTGRGHIGSEVKNCFDVIERYTVVISASQQDIQEFVIREIREDRKSNPEAMDKALEKDIIDAIIGKSQGM